jgi:SAM-dependent MidA family methyltransferase
MCRPLKNGVFLAIDYGDSAEKLIAKGADLRRYLNHTVDGKWWDSPGYSDLTADVDFTRLAYLLNGLGLKPEAHVSLGRWVRANAPLAQWEGEWMDMEPSERQARKHNLMQLTFPDGMGDRFKVLRAVV